MGVRETFGTDVLLSGWGHSPFGKLTDETLESLIVSVATEAMTSAGIEPGQVDEIYVGQFNSGLVPLGFPSSLALQASGLGRSRGDRPIRRASARRGHRPRAACRLRPRQ